MLLQRHENHRFEMFDNLKPLKQLFIEGEAEEVFQMQGEDERREDNTAGEEETTFTTSTQVSLLILTIYVKLWVMDQGSNQSSSQLRFLLRLVH